MNEATDVRTNDLNCNPLFYAHNTGREAHIFSTRAFLSWRIIRTQSLDEPPKDISRSESDNKNFHPQPKILVSSFIAFPQSTMAKLGFACSSGWGFLHCSHTAVVFFALWSGEIVHQSPNISVVQVQFFLLILLLWYGG